MNNSQKELNELEKIHELCWLKYDTYEGLNYKDYASDILNYRPLFGKELNSAKILILIKLWENKTKEGTYHTLEILGRAAGIDSTYASLMVKEMCQSNLNCMFCNREFGILEIIGSYKYETGKEGHLYSLDKIESLLMHITLNHHNPDPKIFYEQIEKIENKPKAKNSEKQLKNLKWKKLL